MIHFENKSKYGVYDLQRLIKILRSPEGCPWDKVQTHESIRRNFLEETYEAVEAIDEQSPEHLCEELGDVMTQVIFHADIEEDAGRFDLDDVADMCVRKLVSRHPHVFADVEADTTEKVLDNWDAIKRVEKHQETVTDSINAVAKTLPALWRAEKMQKKAAKCGFDWPDTAQSMDKLAEELTELSDAVNEETNVAEELGDLLFAAVNLARHYALDPDTVLQQACDKYAERFGKMERLAADKGAALDTISVDEMMALWNKVKEG